MEILGQDDASEFRTECFQRVRRCSVNILPSFKERVQMFKRCPELNQKHGDFCADAPKTLNSKVLSINLILAGAKLSGCRCVAHAGLHTTHRIKFRIAIYDQSSSISGPMWSRPDNQRVNCLNFALFLRNRKWRQESLLENIRSRLARSGGEFEFFFEETDNLPANNRPTF